MKIEIVTLFPNYFESVFRESVIGKGIEKQLFEIDIINLRDYTADKHHTADDTPYGGGGGMVLMIEPLCRCLESLGYKNGEKVPQDEMIILTSAAGKKFDQDIATAGSLKKRLIIICGHYLGVDERLLELFEIHELSIGDYVLTGGEPAAIVMTEAITRLIPGVLGNFESATADSHAEKLLGTPVYTKPEEFLGKKVPKELKSGNHALIERYRRNEAIRKTFLNRPDILDEIELDKDELEIIKILDK